MSLRDWLFNLTRKEEPLILEENIFNPTKELFDNLKTRISDLLSVIEAKDNEIELLRRENLSLQAKITNLPKVSDVPLKHHYVTTSAAKAELERRSQEELKRQKLEAKNRSTN